MTKKKKSQMEIMGLAIIIILITLAMLFVVRFILLKEPTDIKKAFTQKQLASNTVNAMLATTTNCKDLSIAQLLEDCAEGGFIYCPNAQNSCEFAEDAINKILESTLVEWKRNFELRITQIDPLLNFENSAPCPETAGKTASSPCCILPTGLGPMTITLDICD